VYALHAEPASGVGAGVGKGVGDGVGAGVGDRVGAGVGDRVGTGVGDRVGAGVGDRVGEGVGAGVGRRVGTGVGTGVASLQRNGTPLFGSVRVRVANLGVLPPVRSYLTLEAVAATSLMRNSNRRSAVSKVRKHAGAVAVSRLKFVAGARMAVFDASE